MIEYYVNLNKDGINMFLLTILVIMLMWQFKDDIVSFLKK